jgi:hypothetical protein
MAKRMTSCSHGRAGRPVAHYADDRIEVARSAVPAGAGREPARGLPHPARRADSHRGGLNRPVDGSGRCWYRAAGSWWRLLRYFSLGSPLDPGLVRVGFLAHSPAGEGCAATFDRISFRPGAPKDLRDGS